MDGFDFSDEGEIGVVFRENGWTYRGHIGGLSYDFIAPRRYLQIVYTAGYVLPKDATADEPATLPADLEAIVWNMVAQQWAIAENDAAGLSAFSISDVSWTFDKNISQTWQPVFVERGGFLAPTRAGIPAEVQRAVRGRQNGAGGMFYHTRITSKRIE